MAVKIFDADTWLKLCRPDLNSKLYYRKKSGEKVWGIVTSINYGHKKGIQLTITPFKLIK
jgi:hypothetical protein